MCVCVCVKFTYVLTSTSPSLKHRVVLQAQIQPKYTSNNITTIDITHKHKHVPAFLEYGSVKVRSDDSAQPNCA